MEDQWLDADETAASLQITKATLYKLIREGTLPARKVGGKWRFTRESIEELFGAVAVSSPWTAEGDERR